MTQQFKFNKTLLAGVMLTTMLAAGPSEAATLVEFTFGDGTAGTNVAETVAANVGVTPMIVKNGDTGAPVAYDFVDMGSGNMAIHAEGTSLRFLFDLTVNSGYTFQLTDIAVGWGFNTYAGGGGQLELTPNGEFPETGLFSVSGGSMFDTFVPGASYGIPANWSTLSARTDLTSLMFEMSFGGYVATDDGYISYVRLSGDLMPVPVPAAFWLLGSGLLGLIGVARRTKGRAQ